MMTSTDGRRRLLLALAGLAGLARGSHIPASSHESSSAGLLVPKRIIVWFREGNLRVHDNPALHWAAQYEGPKEVIPVFILDTRQFEQSEWGSPKIGSLRVKFLIETVAELRANLKKLGSNLLFGIGEPEELLPLLLKRDRATAEAVERETGRTLPASEVERATTILFETQVTPFESKVSQDVLDAMPTQVSWQHFWGGTLFNRERLPFSADLTDVPDVFADYQKSVSQLSWEEEIALMLPTPGEGSLPLPTPESINEATEGGLDYETLPDVSGQPPNWRRTTWRGATVYAGGETSGLKRLRGYDGECMAVKATAGEEKAKDIRLKTWAPFLTSHPEMLSTKLSPWLANGALSPKMVAYEVNKPATLGGVVENDLIFELMARDFYRLNCAKHGADLYLPDGPAGTDRTFLKMFQASKPAKASKDDEEMIQRWKDGETGIPLIDALMRELLTTGYISYRGRQHVASYFVHDLGLDWRVGADHFQASLLDYNVCSNWGNWAMVAGLSGGGHLSNFPIGEVSDQTDITRKVITFDHVAQAKEFDPLATYTRYWVPELRAVPPKQVHDPWKLTDEEQKSFQVDVRAWSPEESEDTWYPLPVSSYISTRRQLAESRQLSGQSAPSLRLQSRRASHMPGHVSLAGGGGGGGATLSIPGLGMGLSDGEPPSFGSMDGTCSLISSAETNAWFDDWEDKIQAWWAVTPFRDGAQACFGALGVHLMQRLEMMVRLWQIAKGQPAHKPPPGAEGMRSECQTLLENNAEKLQLPDFPDFPAQFEVPPVLPIPRLLPSHGWIQGLGPLPESGTSQHARGPLPDVSEHAHATGSLPAASEHASTDEESAGFESSAMLLSAAGSALGFSTGMAVFFVLKRRRSASDTAARGRIAITSLSSPASGETPQATMEMTM